MRTEIRNTSSTKLVAPKKRIGIVTLCCDDWGGSEELWARSIPYLQQEGFEITVLKDRINRHHSRYSELVAKGVLLKDLDQYSKKSKPEKLFIKAWKQLKKQEQNHLLFSFDNYLRVQKPDLIIVSQGINFDGLQYAHSCAVRKIPYVIICQKAVEFYWPQQRERAFMISAFQMAKNCFFVSKHNQQLTEEQFGFRFSNAKVISNPVRLQPKPLPYPSTENGYKLACVGRLFVIDKGQDILLRVLSQQKWRERPVMVSFVGTGADAEGIQAMAKLLGLSNVEFRGHVDDVDNLWRDYHALVLPSRSEGLALVVLEAMAAGRMVIGTKAGGNEEIVEDDETGFIGEATTLAFDAVMERAWQQKSRWEEMGIKASRHILENVVQFPEIEFANTVTKLVYE